MKRLVLLCCFLISTFLVTAQRYPDEIRKAIKIHDEAMKYFNDMPVKPTKGDIDHVLTKYKEEMSAFGLASSFGTEGEQRLVVYYQTIFRFRLGYMFAGCNDSLNALTYYEYADAYMDSILVKNAFPIDVWGGNEHYSIDGSYFHKILPIMYLDMASLFSGYSHWQETEKYSRLALTCSGITTSGKLRATGILIACLEKKEQEDKEKLTLLLSFWKTLRKADTSLQRQMRFSDAEMLQQVKDLTGKVYAKEDNWSAPGLVAETLLELNKSDDAEFFLKLVLQKKPSIMLPGFDDDFYYKAMMNAYKFRDKDVMRWAALGLAASYLLPSTYSKDLIMILNFVGEREYAKIIRRRYKK